MSTTLQPDSVPAAETEVCPRYPGSPPFADSEMGRLLFEGRTDEATEVANRVLSSDLLVVYGISGTGKTSLLHAGVFERLRGEGLWPVVVRMNDPAKRPVELIADRLVEQAALDGLELLPSEPRAADLWDLLAQVEVWRGDVLQTPVVVFDQFEELFTLDWPRQVRDDFITQFGWVARGHRPVEEGADAGPPPRSKAVILIREDSLGELEALAGDVPHIMRNRFRLTSLDLRQAERAIRGPAGIVDERLASPPFEYTEDAVDLMLDFLRTREERGQKVKTDHVEPSQLQIICQHVEDEIVGGRGDVAVTAADLGGPDGLNAILGDFYRRVVDSFPPDERQRVTELCETGLINAGGRRLSLQVDEIRRTYSVSRPTLEELVRQRLLRSEYRTGSDYFELAHDSLVAPILNDRDVRRREAAAARSRRIRGAIGTVAVLLIVGLGGWALVQAFLLGGESSTLTVGAVSGTVTTADGAADGVTVAFHRVEEGADADATLSAVPGSDAAVTAVSAADGTYTANVPPGTYRILFRSPLATNGNSQYVEQWYPGVSEFADATDVVVGETLTDPIDALMTRTGGISFTVHAGQDPPPVQVSLSGGSIPGSEPLVDTIQGESYEFSDLGPGDYRLSITADGFEPLELTQPLDSAVAALGDLTLISESPLSATFVMRLDGSDVADLAPGQVIETSFVVFNNGTEPITVRSIESELGGAVEIADPVIESGSSRTFTDSVGPISAMTTCPDLTSTAATAVLVADGGGTESSLVAVSQYCELQPATIRAQVQLETSGRTGPAEGVRVVLTTTDEPGQEVEVRATGSDGVAEFVATVGNYLVTVEQPPDTEFTAVAVGGAAQPVGPSAVIEVPVRPAPEIDVTFDLEALEFLITGTVLSDGSPVAGAVVDLIGDDPDPIATTETISDGTFVLSAVDGTYGVTSSATSADGATRFGASAVVVAGADVETVVELVTVEGKAG